ncbi:hypothetical protein H2248_012221 [Termitomyces sp. 'cryptogamus']|nr:hypothetical protein H2248_012221 [Termitomyces sp. 'cryptogamus']
MFLSFTREQQARSLSYSHTSLDAMAFNFIISFSLVFVGIALGIFLVYRRIAPIRAHRSFSAPAKGELSLPIREAPQCESKTRPFDTSSFISQLTTASSVLAEHHARFMVDVTNIRRTIDALEKDNASMREEVRTAHNTEALRGGSSGSFAASFLSTTASALPH